MRKAASAIYLVCDESVAKDVSDLLTKAADRIEKLEKVEKAMTVSFRKLVKHEDLNPAGFLFGGKLLSWIDEAAALYVMCQLETKNIVTVKISESIFKKPVKLGDYLEFITEAKAFGTSSITIDCRVETKNLKPNDERHVVFTCEAVFVAMDDGGKSKPHGKTETKFT